MTDQQEVVANLLPEQDQSYDSDGSQCGRRGPIFRPRFLRPDVRGDDPECKRGKVKKCTAYRAEDGARRMRDLSSHKET